MIPSLAMVWLGAAWAQDAEPVEPVETSEPAPSPEASDEDPLSRYKTPFQVLANRTIGTVSSKLAFNWRRTKIQVGGTGSFLFELNTFNSARIGALIRRPTNSVMIEFGVSYTRVWDSESSRQLAMTAFRQPGRPSRLELETQVAIPLAEGVVTAMPRWFPSAQLVFNATLGFRYSIYPTGYAELRPGQVAAALFQPALSEAELANLEEARLDAMAVDPARYGITAGFTNDIYFERGIFVSPRVQFAVPALAFVTNSSLPFWVDVSLAVGVAL
ncbi:MAG: hypothetical protein AAGA48_22335 [Myxococcota bacterium]